ncbi:ATP-binding cassette domain-containing protein, partial [Escherichia coli]
LIAQMVGREMKNIWPARLGEKPDENVPAKLEVKNLSHPSLFKEVSFAVRPGEVLGFFGLVGAGRSDVMKALFGLVSYHGTVLIDGKEVRIANPKQAIDHGIAFVTENRKEEGLVLMHDINMNTHHVAFQYNASRMGL